MPLYSIHTIAPPSPPTSGADPVQLDLWAHRISAYLTDLPETMEESLEAYISYTEQIATGIITTDLLADSAVTTTIIADSAVTAVKIESSTITTVKLEDSAVTTVKIANANITSGKYATNSINNSHFAALTTQAVTAHASVGGMTTVGFSYTRAFAPLIVPSTTETRYLLTMGGVTSTTANVHVYNQNGPTSCTIYIRYY